MNVDRLRNSSRLTILLPDDLNYEDCDWFWRHGVSMDDWDYMLIAPVDTIEEATRKPRCRIDSPETYWRQIDYTCERLIGYSMESRWHRVEFDEGPRAVGVVYHA